MTDPFAGNLRPTSLDDRRDRRQRPVGEARITVLDGIDAGKTHDITLRHLPADEATFLIRAELSLGQKLRISDLIDGRPTQPTPAEVTRARPLSNGKWEIVVAYRRPAEAPRLSESQRRHERRAKLLGGNGR
jgi:hypothetical protein